MTGDILAPPRVIAPLGRQGAGQSALVDHLVAAGLIDHVLDEKSPFDGYLDCDLGESRHAAEQLADTLLMYAGSRSRIILLHSLRSVGDLAVLLSLLAATKIAVTYVVMVAERDDSDDGVLDGLALAQAIASLEPTELGASIVRSDALIAAVEGRQG